MAGVTIHPTAIVDAAARLGEGVEIGPYVVIEGAAEVGEGCVLQAHATLTGAVRLGRGVRVGHAAVIGGWPQDFSFDPATQSGVEVGEGTQVREHCTIHRGTQPGTATRVGARCLLMAGSHVGHNAQVGSDVVLANNVLLGGYVEVGDRAFLGGGAVFHQFVRVGRGVIVQGVSGFSKDIAPFMVGAEINLVFGLNVVGMRRSGLSPAERAEVKEAFKLLYASGRNVSQALAVAKEREWGAPAAEFLAFAASSSKRGLCALHKRAAEA